MTLNKSDLVKTVMENVHLKKKERERQQYLFPELNYTPLSQRRATDIVDTLFEIIKKTLERGDHLLVSGFGKFDVRFKWARKGRNPRTGERLLLKSRRVVNFQSSQKFRKRINSSTDKDD